MKNLVSLICTLLILAGCGGGGSSGGNTPASDNPTANTPTVETPGQARAMQNRIMPFPTRYNEYDNDAIDIGPTGPGERPKSTNLGSTSDYSSTSTFRVKYGSWNDPAGRDGSVTAAGMVRYLKSFQTQENKEAQEQNRAPRTLEYSASDITVRTIRLHTGITNRERQVVARALREINAALPWEYRLVLASDFTQPSGWNGVPKGEIHIRFTNGKSSWPDGEGYDGTLGIGGVNAMMGGSVLIDTDATQRADPSSAFLQFVLTHELIHAMGIGGHADPNLYPNSILKPTATNWQNARPIYASLDGEALLVNIPSGTRVADLTTSDLGSWDTTGFHLLGFLELDDNPDIEFGAGFRNGLAKPWAHGQKPQTTILLNPTLAGSLRATWSGYLLGFTGNGNTVAGSSEIAIDLKALSGQANFDDLEYWGIKASPGAPGSGTMWKDGDLDYTLAIVREGTIEGFVSTSAPGDDPGMVSGVFVGRAHEGTAGIVKHPDLSAGFGASR